ncbi:hypothetical protein [Jannaschia faecimaris]|uniref:hypothetical protein n=1 Tax=Jannaschia faecimaris TaxID=1244108 RepID=UPI001113BC29|nr:hypothetical protein [Jannaschia faecimaris]
MTKHIVDRTRARSGAAKFQQYVRIDLADKPGAQLKILQKRPRSTDSHARAVRFAEIERRKVE